MKSKNLSALAKKTSVDFLRHPLIALPFLIALLVMYGFSEGTTALLPLLTTNAENIVALIVLSLFALAILSFLFAFFITLCQSITEKNRTARQSLAVAAHSAPKNLFLMILAIALVQGITWLSFIIGKMLLPLAGASWATFIVIACMFAGFAGIAIFLTFAPFYIVMRQSSVIGSIKSSINLVRRRYLDILIITVIFFAAVLLIDRYIPTFIAEVIKSLIIIPYTGLLLAEFLSQK